MKFCPFRPLDVGYRTDKANVSKQKSGEEDIEMITDDFDERTIANMEVALDRVCERFPKQLATHEARKHIAACILERATGGERTLKGLTEAAMMAAMVISSGKVGTQQLA
jgi:hypothetical protein